MCAIASAFRWNVCSRRSRSMARLRAVVTIHAPGLRGVPAAQPSTAAANASWTASSARARSPVARATAATERPHSSRKMRSSDSIERQPAVALSAAIGITGRTSIRSPYLTDGIFAAQSSASSSDSTSIL
jgi:hypothetical protein